jgi:hypothetical protein
MKGERFHDVEAIKKIAGGAIGRFSLSPIKMNNRISILLICHNILFLIKNVG